MRLSCYLRRPSFRARWSASTRNAKRRWRKPLVPLNGMRSTRSWTPRQCGHLGWKTSVTTWLGPCAGSFGAFFDVLVSKNDTLTWNYRAFDLSDRGPRSLVNRRLARHLAYIAQDDALLRREAGTLLTLNELRNALGERGRYVSNPRFDL